MIMKRETGSCRVRPNCGSQIGDTDPGDAAIPPTMTLPRSVVVQVDMVLCPGPGGWALISSANMRNSG